MAFVIAAANHDEFPDSITAWILRAVMRLLTEEGGGRFAAFFEIAEADAEDLFRAESHSPPALGVAIGELGEGYGGTAGVLDLNVVVYLIISWPVQKRARDTRQGLRGRIIDALRAAFHANNGELVDEDGTLLTEGLTEIERMGPPLPYPDGTKPNELREVVRVVYKVSADAQMQLL